jgi:predicted metalloprotease with PDZ domain
VVSYYTKGSLIALALDLTIRQATNDARSLDDVMRALWQRYGARGIGVPEDGFEQLAAEVGGLNLAPFFDAAVRGTDDLPLAALLAKFGITMELRASAGGDDPGGTPRAGNGEVLALGAGYRAREGGLELTSVLEGGSAQRAGLNPGDLLVALDRLRVNERNLRRRLARFESGERVTATAFRGDELIEVGLVLKAAPLDTCYLVVQEQVDAETAKRRDAWLKQAAAP